MSRSFPAWIVLVVGILLSAGAVEQAAAQVRQSAEPG